MQEFDVAIAGAGIIGAAIARELSHYQLRILWLEKADDVGTGVTAGNTSIIHGGFDDAKDSVKGRYSPHGSAMVEALDRDLHFGFYKCGSLVVGFPDAAKPQLEALLANGRSNGTRGLELWGREQLLEREPKLNPAARWALFAPESGVVIAPEFCIALAENAIANGVQLHLNEEVLEIRSRGQGYQLESARGSYCCRYFVNAAGWGAPNISQMLGTLDYQLQAVKGQYLIFDRSCGQMVQHVLFPLPDKVKGKGVTACPTYHGNLLLGPDAEFVTDPKDVSTQLQNLQEIFCKGQDLIPGVPRGKVIRSYAGVRPRLIASSQGARHPKTADFLLRYHKDRCELLGIASPGLTAALPIACEVREHVAQLWLSERRKLGQKSRIVRERKAYVQSQREKAFLSGSELQRHIKLPLDDPECLVCRCEQVKSAVIQDAVARSVQNFPALRSSLTSLKWRTRASMGFCQGQFCKPRLKELLAKLEHYEPGLGNEKREGSLEGSLEKSLQDRVPPDVLRRSL